MSNIFINDEKFISNDNSTNSKSINSIINNYNSKDILSIVSEDYTFIINNLDLTNLNKLEKIDIYADDIQNIILPNPSNLKELTLGIIQPYNTIHYINLENQHNLEILHIHDFSVINFSKNIKLKQLECTVDNLNEIINKNYLEKLIILTDKNIPVNIELPDIPNLKELGIFVDNLKELKIKNNIEKLIIIGENISANVIRSIEKLNNIKDIKIYINFDDNNYIDVSKFINLQKYEIWGIYAKQKIIKRRRIYRLYELSSQRRALCEQKKGRNFTEVSFYEKYNKKEYLCLRCSKKINNYNFLNKRRYINLFKKFTYLSCC